MNNRCLWRGAFVIYSEAKKRIYHTTTGPWVAKTPFLSMMASHHVINTFFGFWINKNGHQYIHILFNKILPTYWRLSYMYPTFLLRFIDIFRYYDSSLLYAKKNKTTTIRLLSGHISKNVHSTFGITYFPRVLHDPSSSNFLIIPCI